MSEELRSCESWSHEENMQVLAAELGVTDRTIRNDILVLTAEYPLETTRGNGGGVRIADWYHPHKNIFSQDQISVLEQLMDKADDEQKKVLDQMLREYGSNKYSPAVQNLGQADDDLPSKYIIDEYPTAMRAE